MRLKMTQMPRRDKYHDFMRMLIWFELWYIDVTLPPVSSNAVGTNRGTWWRELRSALRRLANTVSLVPESLYSMLGPGRYLKITTIYPCFLLIDISIAVTLHCAWMLRAASLAPLPPRFRDAYTSYFSSAPRQFISRRRDGRWRHFDRFLTPTLHRFSKITMPTTTFPSSISW